MAAVEILSTNTYASVAALRELANRISHRVPAAEKLTVVEEFGVAELKEAPIVKLVDESGVTMALIAMQAQPTVRKDILGLPQTAFSPHVVKFALNAALPDSVKYGAVLGEIYRLGTKVEMFPAVSDEADDGSGGTEPTGIPVEADLAGTASAVWVNDIFWPVNGSI